MPPKRKAPAPEDSTTRRLAIVNIAWRLLRGSETATGSIDAATIRQDLHEEHYLSSSYNYGKY